MDVAYKFIRKVIMWQADFTSFFPITWNLLETTEKYRFLQT